MTWISWRNLLLAASLTATRETAQLPVAKLKIPVVAERYRAAGLSAGDTRTIVKMEWTAPLRPAVAVWFRPRRRAVDEEEEAPSFAASDLVRHRLSTTAAHDGDVYDSGDIASGALLGHGVHAHVIPGSLAPPTALFAAFEFDALSRAVAPANFVDWGYAHYGYFDLEPEIDYAAAAFQWSEGATRQFAWDASAVRIRRKHARRRWRLGFRNIRYLGERNAVEDFLEYAGDGGRFVIGLDAAAGPRDVMLAMLDNASWSRTARKVGALEVPVIEAI
jgi:hypothetical protein